MRGRWQDILFAVLVAAALSVAVLAALVWRGHFVSDGSEPLPTKNLAARVAHKTTARTAATTAWPPPATKPDQTVAHRTVESRVQIVASRGDCWVSAREGSPRGPALVARVLHTGETVTLRGRKIWLELGAAGNVDVSVDGKARPVPSGTTNVVLG
jgi:RodZ C-terminal domain